MPICNKILAIAAMTALFAAPVFADGTPGQRVNRGPAPLQAHNMTPPEPGCVLVEGKMWSCPVPQTRYTHAPSRTHTAPRRQVQQTTQTVRRSAPTTTRRTYTRTVPATTTTRRTRSAARTRTVAAPSALTLDLASFSGGVGNGVDGGFYGGGGTIVLGGERRFSGVLSHAASSFTFRQRRSHRGGGGGGGGGCGCMGGMGGGMGGGD